MPGERTDGRGGRAVRWVFTVLFLALAPWFIAGAIWGTWPSSSSWVLVLLVVGVGFLIVGLLFLWAAISERPGR